MDANGVPLPAAVKAALTANGMTGGMLKASTFNGNNIGVFALDLPSADAAKKVADAYAQDERNGGIPASSALSYQGVHAFSATGSGQGYYRAVYVLYKRVIIVDVAGTNPTVGEQDFKQLLDNQLAQSPPSVS
jgi:hypothetical protein